MVSSPPPSPAAHRAGVCRCQQGAVPQGGQTGDAEAVAARRVGIVLERLALGGSGLGPVGDCEGRGLDRKQGETQGRGEGCAVNTLFHNKSSRLKLPTYGCLP